MKQTITTALVCAAAMSLISCKEDGQTTTVSKSLWSNDTIVSHSTSNGSFTRTHYGHDFWGNPQTTVTRGHSNATQQGDLAAMAWKLGEALLADQIK